MGKSSLEKWRRALVRRRGVRRVHIYSSIGAVQQRAAGCFIYKASSTNIEAYFHESISW